MGNITVKEGMRFGSLTVVSNEGGMWLCQCKCGTPLRATTFELVNGKINSCCFCQRGGK